MFQDRRWISFSVVDVEYDGKEYVVFLPPEEDVEDADSVIILQITEDPADEDVEEYIEVKDEEILAAV